MRVTIRELDLEGNPVTAGEFRLEGGKVIADKPDNQLMHRILTEPVTDHRTGDIINPDTHPEAWLKELCYFFNSAYLSASRPF
jgi:hypothetical protein